MKRMSSLRIAGAAAALAAAFGAVHAETVVIREAPPAPIVEEVPAARVGYVWAPGHYVYRTEKYVWTKGEWLPERHGYHYREARWVQHPDGTWTMVAGTWVRAAG